MTSLKKNPRSAAAIKEARGRVTLAMAAAGVTKVEAFVPWEQAEASKCGGCYVEHAYGLSSWFFIKGEQIWSLYTDTSDGGCWNATGPLVQGCKAPMTDEIRSALQALDQAYEADKAATMKARVDDYGYKRRKMN